VKYDKSMQVKAHVLRDPATDNNDKAKVGNVDFAATAPGADRDLATVRAIAEGGTVPIHFTTVKYYPNNGLVYCGLSAAENDLLWSFDPKTKKFVDCGFNRISDENDHKLHQTLDIASDGVMWGGTSGWVDHSNHAGRRGGSLFSYDPRNGDLKSHGIPCPHDYIQYTVLDEPRRAIYGGTYPHLMFFRWDMDTGRVRTWFTGSMMHRAIKDDDGFIWGTYRIGVKENFFKYDPDADQMHHFQFGLPGISASFDAATPDTNVIDSIINGGDGYIYIGTNGGSFCRLDPRKEELQYLCKPVANGRLSNMQIAKDGRIFLGAGFGELTSLIAYDRETGAYTNYGLIRDEEMGHTDMVVHQMTITDDGTIYCGETDQGGGRSAYLWECVLED